MKIKEQATRFKNWCFKASVKKKALFVVLLIGLGVLTKHQIVTPQNKKATYETTKAEKGTLMTSVSASGTITSGNSTSVDTKVSGVVEAVYVTNGDTATKGQKIADVAPDEYAAQRETAAWVSYLDAKEAVKTAEKERETADLQMWEDRQAILDAEEDIDYMNNHKGENPDTDEPYTVNEETVIVKTLTEARKAFSESELKYKNAQSEITAAQTKVASAWRDYQENSSTIYAPAAGVISDLALAPGIVINASSSTSSSTGATIISSQTVGKISTNAQLIATVNLSEIDVVNVKANQKVSLTLDAYPDKTFTGKILAVNTAGSVSSGVTSYPVSVLLDTVSVDIYPNMAVNAQIITSIKNEVLLVPTTAITTTNDQSIIQVKKDDEISTVQVETGSSNDSQTEIISGINEGDEVVTSVIVPEDNSQTNQETTSPFSGLGRSSRSSERNIGGPPGGF